ncbi:MAG: hypothetical protein K6E71_06185 [Lachnospiraceae bacterium]|nr:hypothetical protein [Lachnospiraceae bacterium]
MKRLFLLLICAACIITLCACRDKITPEADNNPAKENNPSITEGVTPSPTGTPTTEGVTPSPTGTPTDEPEPKSAFSEAIAYVRANATTDKAEQVGTIPVVDDMNWLFGKLLGIGRDFSIIEGSDGGETSIVAMLHAVSAPAIRKMSEDMYYLMFKDKSGNVFYQFLSEQNGLSFLVGYGVMLTGAPKKYEDFQKIEKGSTLSDVLKIDDVARAYYHLYCEIGTPSEGTIEIRKESSRNPYHTVHYLQDGLLIYYYEAINESGDLVITDIYFSADYKKQDSHGREIDYRINELDYPRR